MKKSILICAGESDPGSLSQLKKQSSNNKINSASGSDVCIVCADGGVKACRDAGLVPDIIIGDFDSLERDPLDIYPTATYPGIEIIKLPKEKDDTDTLAAIRLLADRGFEEVNIYGASGGRFDHYFANVQAIVFAKRHGIKAYIHEADARIFVIENESIVLDEKPGTIFSMFSLGDAAKGVTVKGLKYEVENAIISNDFPIGVSNEFVGNKAEINVTDGALLIYVGNHINI